MNKRDKIQKSCHSLRSIVFDGLVLADNREAVMNYVAILSKLNDIQSINVREEE
jgi:hypothetical protein